jgi:hypothetical protein
MSICYADHPGETLPLEARLLDEVIVRLVEGEAERQRHDDLLEREHYLRNANAIGQVLRYVAEYRGEWVAVLTFCSAALHLKPRDRFLHWPARQVKERRHLLAQNSRFLVRPSTGRWPNLASRVLQLVCARLAQDWQCPFGHPVLLVETFVDPQRFRGTCYRAANWQALGRTRGFSRRGQDYYTDTQHPKELWVYPLGRPALRQLRAPVLAEALRAGGQSLPPPGRGNQRPAHAANDLPERALRGPPARGRTGQSWRGRAQNVRGRRPRDTRPRPAASKPATRDHRPIHFVKGLGLARHDRKIKIVPGGGGA